MQVEDYLNDKLNFPGPVRARTANEIMKGFRALGRRHSELVLPILAVHGTRDHCTSLPVSTLLLLQCNMRNQGAWAWLCHPSLMDWNPKFALYSLSGLRNLLAFQARARDRAEAHATCCSQNR